MTLTTEDRHRITILIKNACAEVDVAAEPDAMIQPAGAGQSLMDAYNWGKDFLRRQGAAMTIESLATKIAEELFINGSRERAQRLVLTVDTPSPRNLGGWSQRAAADLIAGVLRKHRVGASPAAPQEEPKR